MTANLEERLRQIFLDNVIVLPTSNWSRRDVMTPGRAHSEFDNTYRNMVADRQAAIKRYDQLESVADQGLTRETYETNTLVINQFIRDEYLDRGFSCGGPHAPTQDRNAREPTQDILDRFPEDGAWGAGYGGTHCNVAFERDRHFEGTLYHRVYSDDGSLESIRVFNQSHRDSLQVVTVSGEELLEKISTWVDARERPEAIQEIMREDEYETLMLEFNEEAEGVAYADASSGWGVVPALYLEAGRDKIFEALEREMDLSEGGIELVKEGGYPGVIDRRDYRRVHFKTREGVTELDLAGNPFGVEVVLAYLNSLEE